MNIAEIILLVLLFIGGYQGYTKGLLREVIAMIALVLGIIAGSVFIEEGKAFILKFFNTYSSALPVFSFLLIFICVVVVVTLSGRALKSAIDLTPIGYLDGAGGAILGVLKWVFVISLMLWGLDMADVKIKAVEESQWYGRVKFFGPVVIEKLKVWFPALKDFIKEAGTFFESLKS